MDVPTESGLLLTVFVAVTFLGSARGFEKPPIGGDLSVLPFLGFPAVGSGPQATNQDGKLPNRAFFGDEEPRSSVGFLEEPIMVATHSWQGIWQRLGHPASLGFDLAPSIRLRWRAERAGRPVCPSGERPTTATGESRANCGRRQILNGKVRLEAHEHWRRLTSKQLEPG